MITYKLTEAPLPCINNELLRRNFDRKVVFFETRVKKELYLKNIGVVYINNIF